MNSINTTKPKILIKYVPHGIDSTKYFPTEVPDEFRKHILGSKEYDFVLFWSNRNIKRKQPADVIYAYKLFCDEIGKEKADKTCLIMHTRPIDENGTDLYAVVDAVASECNVIFSEQNLDQTQLNYLYNIADATINIANNEGFGLTTAESVMAGTPIIVNVTGGLQDQCGFRIDGKLLTADDYIEIGSLHNRREWSDKVTWGEWVIPIWSAAQSLAGSVTTPYIFDDRVDLVDTKDAILQMYNIPTDQRQVSGRAGREVFITNMGLSSSNMCEQMISGIEETIQNWKPKNRYEIYKM